MNITIKVTTILGREYASASIVFTDEEYKQLYEIIRDIKNLANFTLDLADGNEMIFHPDHVVNILLEKS